MTLQGTVNLPTDDFDMACDINICSWERERETERDPWVQTQDMHQRKKIRDGITTF